MKRFFSLGLIRGLLLGAAGAAVGMALTMGLRLLTGRPAWEAGAVSAIGVFTGVVAFMIGVGGFRDWWREARNLPVTAPGAELVGQPRWVRYLSFDPNHKTIGVQYVVTGLVMMAIAGSFALTMRTELSQSGLQFLSTDSYNHLMSVHGIMMIGVILIGVGGVGNYLVPLLIGASDMAFPRLNAFGYWLNPPAAILFLTSLFTGGFDTGWVGYPPLGARDPLGAQFFYLGMFFLGLGSILGAINIITTILKLRVPGMTLFRMPILVWGILATVLIQFIATQFIAMAFLMVVAERLLGMGFFDPAKGGNPLLYQHIFWFYSHPAVYVFVLPGFGVISELLPVFSRKPLFGYGAIALSSMAIAFLGFMVWAHHMFSTGLSTAFAIVTSFSTMTIAVPTGVKIFSWLATLWRGKLTFPAPMMFVLGAIAIFLFGGLTGPFLAIVPVDLVLTKTYWVVAHFHQTIFGGFVFPFFAAIYYWFPKVTRFRLNDRLGRVNFWLLFVGFVTQTYPQYRLGLLGMIRRIADYTAEPHWVPLNITSTVGGFLVGLSFLTLLINIITTLRARVPVPANPWNSRSLEWQLPSPPPEENYRVPPVVVGRPYDYGVPNSVYVRLGEEEKPAGVGR